MAFSPKTWASRIVQYPSRRILTPTGNTNEYDVFRSEGNITQAGDILSAENLNDLETRIAAQFAKVPEISSGTWTPTMYGETIAGSPTYTTHAGTYIKIGSLVNVFGAISISELGGMSGYLHIGGFPYVPSTPSATSDFNGGWSSDNIKPVNCYVSSAGIALPFEASNIPIPYSIWSFHAVYYS